MYVVRFIHLTHLFLSYHMHVIEICAVFTRFSNTKSKPEIHVRRVFGNPLIYINVFGSYNVVIFNFWYQHLYV